MDTEEIDVEREMLADDVRRLKLRVTVRDATIARLAEENAALVAFAEAAELWIWRSDDTDDVRVNGVSTDDEYTKPWDEEDYWCHYESHRDAIQPILARHREEASR